MFEKHANRHKITGKHKLNYQYMCFKHCWKNEIVSRVSSIDCVINGQSLCDVTSLCLKLSFEANLTGAILEMRVSSHHTNICGAPICQSAELCLYSMADFSASTLPLDL